jgi:hypothetical protein
MKSIGRLLTQTLPLTLALLPEACAPSFAGLDDAPSPDSGAAPDAGDAAHAGDSRDARDEAHDGAAPPPADAASDADVGPPVPDSGGPIEVLQHPVCPYGTKPDMFACTFPVANVAGNAFLVHFYYNYGDPTLGVTALTDDDSNTYSFLDVGDVDCPAAELPDAVCCTTLSNMGSCQGWALATNVKVAAHNPATITLTITGSTGSDIMGAEILEIRGLASIPLDKSAATGTSPGTSVATPTITTSAPGDLIVAGFAAYSSGSVLTAPLGWSLQQDYGYFAAAEYEIGGPAGSHYKGTGTITAMNYEGTSTIIALKKQ